MRYLKSLLAIALVFNLSSCTLTENITIHENGSGNFTFDMDASSLMAMVPADSLKSEKAIDTTFTFKELLDSKRDSIAKLPLEEQEKLKRFSAFTLRTKMNYETKEFLYSMGTDFRSVADLKEVMASINEIQRLNPEKSESGAVTDFKGIGNNNTELRFAFNGKKFTRKVIAAEKTVIPDLDAEESYKMIYESSTYVLKYHFPKPVKKVSNSNAVISEDRKSVTIEYPFTDYMTDPEKLNIEVQF